MSKALIVAILDSQNVDPLKLLHMYHMNPGCRTISFSIHLVQGSVSNKLDVAKRTREAVKGVAKLENVGVRRARGTGGHAQLAAGLAQVLSRKAAGPRRVRQIRDLRPVALHN